MNPKYSLEDCEKAIIVLWKSKMNNQLKEGLMDRLIWKITEINGKYNTKFASKKAIKLLRLYKNNQRERSRMLCHEHIISRKKTRKDLVRARNISELKSIIQHLEACIITREEHKKINHNLEGYKKYKEANIEYMKLPKDLVK